MAITPQQTVQLKQVSRGNFLMSNVLKHNVLFREGTKGDAAYILTEGKIEISGTVEGHNKVFANLTPVSIFGEMALFLDEGVRTATATAREDSKVIKVTKDDFDEYLQNSPKVITSIITVLVNRLKTTTQKAMKVPSANMGVVRMLDMFVANGAKELKYESTLKSLADSFLTTTEKIEHYIQELADQGLLTISRNNNERRVIQILEQDLFKTVVQNKKNKLSTEAPFT
ncbi:Crp/Fnr family transcriptional regulator [Maridesulfovibrio frigidus]|uniref:Crp/Fnr family transcriptional regulator n=1 Tax=Maridesulfovibrio frigidus TaxID=340956 RepID=UPI0004E28BD9|nr:cyclic nucleotide-binding domain-containing protein [Maridesulfovibrio frigidus]